MKQYFTWRHTVMGMTILLMATGCTTTAPMLEEPQTVPSHNVYNQPVIQETPIQNSDSVLFKQGHRDGCTTAHGKYTKDRTLFNTEQDYNDGWFAGRQKCQKHAI